MDDIEEGATTFVMDDRTHTIGDLECEGCGWEGFPRPCRLCGEGVVHGQFFEESWDGYSLLVRCDACGEDDRES